MNWITAKVMQYIAAALLVACIGLGAKGCALKTQRDLATAALATAQADKRTAETERDSWKLKAKDAQAANAVYDTIFEQQRAEAEAQRVQAAAAAKQAAAVVSAAKRDEAAAEVELDRYRNIYGTRTKDCDSVLKALDQVCPSLEHY